MAPLPSELGRPALLGAVALALAASACSGPRIKMIQVPPAEVERRLYRAVLADTPCPCGGDHLLDACQRRHEACRATADAASRMALRLVRAGLALPDVVTLVGERFRAKPVAFNLKGAHCRGNDAAAVTIVEYSDFECPFCRRAAGVLRGLERRFEGRVRLCFRHYPLSYHPNADFAARAAEVAAAHGKFWEMHDLLYKDGPKLSEERIVEMATSLGLEEGAFRAAVGEAGVREAVDRDLVDGARLGVRGTPAVFVGGRPFNERLDEQSLSAWIEDALAGIR